MARKVLPLVAVSDGFEVGSLELRDDGTVTTTGGGAAAGILRTRMREFEETEAEAFRALDRDGWSNGNLMIALT